MIEIGTMQLETARISFGEMSNSCQKIRNNEKLGFSL